MSINRFLAFLRYTVAFGCTRNHAKIAFTIVDCGFDRTVLSSLVFSLAMFSCWLWFLVSHGISFLAVSRPRSMVKAPCCFPCSSNWLLSGLFSVLFCHCLSSLLVPHTSAHTPNFCFYPFSSYGEPCALDVQNSKRNRTYKGRRFVELLLQLSTDFQINQNLQNFEEISI